jgi:hypothetical protein
MYCNESNRCAIGFPLQTVSQLETRKRAWRSMAYLTQTPFLLRVSAHAPRVSQTLRQNSIVVHTKLHPLQGYAASSGSRGDSGKTMGESTAVAILSALLSSSPQARV